jgi:hypothetical protein
VYTFLVFCCTGGEEAGSPLSAQFAFSVPFGSLPHYFVTSLLRFRPCRSTQQASSAAEGRIVEVCHLATRAIRRYHVDFFPAHHRPLTTHCFLTPLQSALPKKAPVTSLESADPKTQYLKAFGIRRSEKRWGEGCKLLTRNSPLKRNPSPTRHSRGPQFVRCAAMQYTRALASIQGNSPCL